MIRQALSFPARAILRSGTRIAAPPRQVLRPQFRLGSPTWARAISFSSRWTSDKDSGTTEQPAMPAGEEAGPPQAASEAPTPEEGPRAGEKAEAPKVREKAEAPLTPEEELAKKLRAKDLEIREWKDNYLRAVADFRNLQERSARDMRVARDYAIQRFAKDLVDSVDNLDRALQMVPPDKLAAGEKTDDRKDLAALHEGLAMTEAALMQTLARHGVERFDPAGEPFNPNEHEATFMTPVPDKEHNTVFHVQQKGFRLNKRVLRAAKVGVVKNK